MTTAAKVTTYQYVNRPYDRVRATLHQKEGSLFQAATRAATARTDSLASTLKIAIQGFELGVDVHLEVFDVTDRKPAPPQGPGTAVRLGWKAARAASIFPQMEATLSAWPLSADETQLELSGSYQPPLGSVGKALDTLLLHRIAEAALHRFLEDVVEQLRKDLRIM